ncbi:hypothetical protein B0T19DRAFT_483060 [Cercophora scortea]|uniref:BTB domain-containing protein n=1 Tax=Cercophora scortea TaxID=314031 RepID=A0AAE0IX35_9PEZI|nr:hypothetical protein B0T19DRAFT_483060 [Cercophora scortea]
MEVAIAARVGRDPVILDQAGDLLLFVKDDIMAPSAEFLVSSKILCLNSPVFAAMLGHYFNEGQLLRQGGGQPKITVKGDSADTMQVLLAILHCKPDLVPRFLEPLTLARFAVQCDKYDCATAVRGWAHLWCETCNCSGPDLNNPLLFDYDMNFDDLVRARNMSPRQVHDITDRGYLVLATWLLLPQGSTEQEVIFEAHMKNIPPYFKSRNLWESLDPIKTHLPPRIIEGMALCIDKILQDMLQQTENIAKPGRLISSHACFRMPGKQCLRCGWTTPLGPGSLPRNGQPAPSHRCVADNRGGGAGDSEPFMVDRMCNHNLRMAEYFRLLEMADFWPVTFSRFAKPGWDPRQSKTVHQVIWLLQQVVDRNEHVCDGGIHHCPLHQEMAQLLIDVRASAERHVGAASSRGMETHSTQTTQAIDHVQVRVNCNREDQVEKDSETERKPKMEIQLRMVFDNHGDVILFVKDTERHWGGEFLVSSKVLTLASPVFATMMGPNFMEGQKLRSGQAQGKPPTITVEEDDLDAMQTILGVLHFKINLVPSTITPEQIAKIAVHCDKYDCAAPLRLFVFTACRRFSDDLNTSSTEKGLLFLAGCLLNAPELDPSLAEEQIKSLPCGFSNDFMRVPLIKTHLDSRKIDWIIRRLQREIENTLTYLGGNSEPRSGACFRMPGAMCDKCGAILTWNGDKEEFAKLSPCSSCVNDSEWSPSGPGHRPTIVERECTHSTRVVDLLRILVNAGLFPISAVFDMSVSQIVRNAEYALAMGESEHPCDGGRNGCPLRMSLVVMAATIKRVSESIRAVDCLSNSTW